MNIVSPPGSQPALARLAVEGDKGETGDKLSLSILFHLFDLFTYFCFWGGVSQPLCALVWAIDNAMVRGRRGCCFWFRHRFFLPTDFVVILRLAAVRCGTPVRFFLTHLRRDCSRLRWWPTWNAAKDAAAGGATGYLSDDAGDGDAA